MTRHEDDLRAEAYANGGAVPLTSLMDHLRMVTEHPEAYGSSVTEPLRALLDICNAVAFVNEGAFPERAFVRTTEL